MTQTLVMTAVLFIFVLLGVIAYGSILGARIRPRETAKRVARRFRRVAIALAVACFVVGLLYRLHVLPLWLAGILYIPVVIGFGVGMIRLQPYLTPHEEE